MSVSIHEKERQDFFPRQALTQAKQPITVLIAIFTQLVRIGDLRVKKKKLQGSEKVSINMGLDIISEFRC